MIQTLVWFLLLMTGVAFLQANISAAHSLSPLVMPGKVQIQPTYLGLIWAMGGALTLLWIAGLIDVTVGRAQLRRRNAMICGKDKELVQMQSLAYHQQRRMLADIKECVEAIIHYTRKTLNARSDEASPAIRKRVDARAIREMFPPTGTRSAASGSS